MKYKSGCEMALKSAQIKQRTAVLTLDTPETRETYVRALLTLLGGYNAHGRGIQIDKYKALKVRFDSVIWECEQELK